MISVISDCSRYNLGKSKHFTRNFKRTSDISDSYDSVNFKGIRVVYNLDLAKKASDIPKNANIFIHSPKSKFKIPEGTNARECILTDRGASSWSKLFRDWDNNMMEIKGCNVEYAHGEFTDPNEMTWGGILVNNSNIEQIEHTRFIDVRNNSQIKLAKNIQMAEVENSIVDELECSSQIELKKGNVVGSVKAMDVIAHNGNEIKNVKGVYFDALPDASNPNRYSVIDVVDINGRADINQAKINKMKARIASIRDSIVNYVTADAIFDISNVKIGEMCVNSVNKASNCKISNLRIKGNSCEMILKDKIQIDALNLESQHTSLYLFPKPEWGKRLNNYIKRINVSRNERSPKPYTPVVNLQGDINIEEINFLNEKGIVRLTGPKPEKEIKVTNGTIEYNAPNTEIPSSLYDELPSKY